MVVCVCYNLNEEKINKALEEGVIPAEIHEHFECDAPCEVCMETIEEMFEEKDHK